MRAENKRIINKNKIGHSRFVPVAVDLHLRGAAGFETPYAFAQTMRSVIFIRFNIK